MKTITVRMCAQPTQLAMIACPFTSARALRRFRAKTCSALLRLGAGFLAAGFVASCATAPSRPRSEPGQAERPACAPTNQWVKVNSNPPTWYPRGTPADQPTDFRSGEWVYTEDALGSRYYIPLRGLPAERRALLRREALAARSSRKVARIAAQDALQTVRNGTLTLLALTPPGWYVCMAHYQLGPGPGEGGIGGGLGGISPQSIDVDCNSMPEICVP